MRIARWGNDDLFADDPLVRWGWHEHMPVWDFNWLTDDLQPHPFPDEFGGEG